MIRLLSGDCRDVLATLPAESVQCVVTSPPYYGLRDYQTALWDGGDAACDHALPSVPHTGLAAAAERSDGNARNLSGTRAAREAQFPRRQCSCGAVRVDRQIGLEATPDEYLATMVAVFREVRRVLRRDGTCWVNMGDSYAAHHSGNNGYNDGRVNRGERTAAGVPNGAKPKDLLLMPARLALALQSDGWWVRSDIIWHKPNPMPESVTDRPTSAHEHVFLLTRSARYFYDADAVREAMTGEPHAPGNLTSGRIGYNGLTDNCVHQSDRIWGANGTRNLRNVWTIATSPFSAAHFATFSPELAERCIKAGTSERGCCAACGKPWGRTTEYGKAVPLTPSDAGRKSTWTIGDAARDPDSRTDTPLPRHYRPVVSTGWSPGCDHDAPTVPCVVLDPFAGAGTTLLVADRLQRDAIGIELNTAYTEMAMERCRQDAPLLTSFPPAEPPEDERMADLFTDMAAD